MSNYLIVIWFSGELGDLDSTEESELAHYLDEGGTLFLSAQDYHWVRGLTLFMGNYLGVGSITDDSGGYSDVGGLNDFADFLARHFFR